MILMLFSFKNSSRENRDQDFLTLWEAAAPNIPVLKQAKAAYNFLYATRPTTRFVDLPQLAT
jgi:hypothetical protein